MTLTVTTTIASRFPLVSRPRPPAKPLDARVSQLAGLAETAHRERDPDKASMVFNGAALVASDCGDAELARAWCHRHIGAYLSHAPLTRHAARFALEPVVNLARLRIRAGDGDAAHGMLTALHQGIAHGTHVTVDQLELSPQQLPADPSERGQLVDWLRGVLLIDGTRALTSTGRWADALAHVRRYGGVGSSLLDGRQVVAVAHILQGDSRSAAMILSQTEIEQPWEDAVRHLLQSWCAKTSGPLSPAEQAALTGLPSRLPQAPRLAHFRVRLGLTTLDLASHVAASVASSIIEQLVADVIYDEDANAACELLTHSAVGPEHHRALAPLIESSAVGLGHLPDPARNLLSTALALAESAILGAGPTRSSLAR